MSPSPEGRDRAKQIVERLTHDAIVGNRLAVQVMQLDILHAETPAPLDRIKSILSRIVHSAILTEQTFKMCVDDVSVG